MISFGWKNDCGECRWCEKTFFDTGCYILPVPLCVCLYFQVRVYSGVSVSKTHHARRQRGQIQHLLVLLKGEKLQKKDQDKWAVRKSQHSWTDIFTQIHTHIYTLLDNWLSFVSTESYAVLKILYHSLCKWESLMHILERRHIHWFVYRAKGKMPAEAS